MKLKYIVIFESILIIILIGIIIASNKYNQKKDYDSSLLSPRVYSGILEPQSYLIFNFSPLKTDLQEIIEKNNYNVSVYVENLRDGTNFGIKENRAYFPASLNKLLIATIIMQKVEEGKINLDTKVPIHDSDRASTFGSLYKTNKTELTLRTLIEEMLKNSDNTAFYAIAHNYINDNDLSFLLYYLDYFKSNNGTEKSGMTSPKSMSNVFASLYLSTLLQTKDSEYLLSLLTKDVFNIKKIANLPDDAKVAHKFGYDYTGNNKIMHDCGIMYIDQSRIFYCIMTKDLSEDKATEFIGTTVNKIYTYVKNARDLLDTKKINP